MSASRQVTGERSETKRTQRLNLISNEAFSENYFTFCKFDVHVWYGGAIELSRRCQKTHSDLCHASLKQLLNISGGITHRRPRTKSMPVIKLAGSLTVVLLIIIGCNGVTLRATIEFRSTIFFLKFFTNSFSHVAVVFYLDPLWCIDVVSSNFLFAIKFDFKTSPVSRLSIFYRVFQSDLKIVFFFQGFAGYRDRIFTLFVYMYHTILTKLQICFISQQLFKTCIFLRFSS